METISETISEAIARSTSHSENVDIDFDGDIYDAINAVNDVFNGETDYAEIWDCETCTLEVWGWTDNTPDNEQDWWLSIRLTEESQ